MAKSIKKLLKSFTLIELIIVIAIIAVLGATAFLLLTQWMSKGRDAQRISDLSTIKTALDIAITKNDELPLPDENNVLLYSGTKILNQGKFGDQVVKSIGTLNKVPRDRLNGEYEYSLLSDRLTYKVQAIVENEQNKSAYISKVFADELYYRYIGTVLRGIIVGDEFIYLPNMFLTGYINGQYDLGSGMNVFLGNKVGEYFSGGIVNKDNKDGIIAMMTGLGLSINEATSIFSKATGVSTSTTGNEQITGPVLTNGECGTANGGSYAIVPNNNLCSAGNASEVNGTGPWNWTCNGSNGGTNANCTASKLDTSWCYYGDNVLSNAHSDWNSTELKYDTASNKCYVFGDEDANAKAACNKWVTDNVTQGGEFVWVPARWFVTDGNGTDMKDIFYQRTTIYNGKDYVCRGFAIAKYEMTYKDLTINPNNSLRNTYSYITYGNGQGGIVSKPGYPIGNVTQLDAINICKSFGTDYHLVTNNEWMVAARNVEQQGINWSSGTKGIGGLFVGIAQGLTYGCNGQDTDGHWGVTSTNGTCTRRIHTLSNNNQIWDMGGNVGEHVDRGNTPSTLIANVGNGNLCLTSNYWHVNGNPATTCANNYGPIYSKGGTNNGMGYVYNNSGNDKVFGRGGAATESPSGIFSLGLSLTSNTQNHTAGFRCSR